MRLACALALALACAGSAAAHEEDPPASAPTAGPAPPATPAASTTHVPAPAADAARAGRYFLQGVMETGSELQLDGQGTFQWYFSYGALDLAARGRWRHDGADVVLEVQEFLAPPGFDAMKFDRLNLRADGPDLVPAWPWDGGAERGRYTRE
jgi:hypothetical protein